MDYTLTVEQESVKQWVKAFVKDEVAPFVAQFEDAHEFPTPVIAKMADRGLMGLPISKELGGAGADMISYNIALEEIAAEWPALSTIMAVHTSVGTLPIISFGTQAQIQKYVPALARGQIIGGFAITEPEAGSDVANTKTVAVLSTDGKQYVLNGQKVFITNGSVADSLIIMASTDQSKGPRGLTAFIVDKGTLGFSYGTQESKMGMHASDTSELIFEDCAIPVASRLGNEGDGLKIALSALDGGRIGIGAQCVGIARGAFERALTYVREQKQAGDPIDTHHTASLQLADMATAIESARFMVLNAAFLKDTGKKYSREASMAKLYASEVATETASKAVQILGERGFTRKYDVERFLRDAKVTEIYEGTSEIQRLVIARDLLK